MRVTKLSHPIPLLASLALLLSLAGCQGGSETDSTANANSTDATAPVAKGGSDAVAFAAAAPTLVAKPGSVQARTASTGIQLQWSQASQADAQYRVYWQDDGLTPDTASPYVDVYEPRYTHEDAVPGLSYLFRVSSVVDGVESALSAPMRVTP